VQSEYRAICTSASRGKNWFRNLGVIPPKNFGGPKTANFRQDFGQLRDMIANISGLGQDIIDQKRRCKLQSLPYTLAKFGELWSTNGEK